MKNLCYLLVFLLPLHCLSQPDYCDIIKTIDTAFLKYKKCNIVTQFEQLYIRNYDSFAERFNEYADADILKGLFTKSRETEDASFPSAECLRGVHIIPVNNAVKIAEQNKMVRQIDPEIEDSIKNKINAINEMDDDATRDANLSHFLQTDFVVQHRAKINDSTTRIVFLSQPVIFKNYALIAVGVAVGINNSAYYECLLTKNEGRWIFKKSSLY